MEIHFSKLSFTNTKLRSSNLQDHLETLLAISIEEESDYNIYVDDVIETLKILKSIDRFSKRMEL